MEADIKIFDVVDSTNDTLKDLADNGALEGTCVVAFCQKKGRGRSGRSFYSPDGGNLYMSLLLRPGNRSIIEMITVIAAVATVKAIKEEFGIDTGIKWVNDIIYQSKKVSGILAVAHDPGKDGYVILGIGINIYESSIIPEDIRGIYGSLLGTKCELSDEEKRFQAVRLARRIIHDFSHYYNNDLTQDAVSYYRDKCIVIANTIEYMSGESVMSARVIDIDDHGGIVLECDGNIKTYRDGEIRVVYDDMNLA